MQSIHLVLGRSKYLENLFFILHVGASLMLLWALISGHPTPELLWLSMTLIFLSWHNCLVKHAFKTDPHAVRELIYLSRDEQWQLRFVNGKQIFTKLSADSVLIFGITLLKFKQEGYFLHIPILIAKDSIGNEDFRLLSKWWRQHG